MPLYDGRVPFISEWQTAHMTSEFDRDQVVSQVSSTLQAKYPERDAAEVERVVAEEVDALAGKPVQDYISVLSERAAKKRLKN